MAIDTTNEKYALLSWLNIFMFEVPISSDGLGQADNQQLLWGYPGILWSAVVARLNPFWPIAYGAIDLGDI